jgi:general secretion pathway protein H
LVTGAASHERGTAGFTLLELLVVLGIVALLMTVVPPLLSAAAPGLRAKAAARDVATTLRGARAAAVTRGRPVDVSFDAGVGQYVVSGATSQALPDGFMLAPSDGGRAPASRYTVRFYPDGSSSGFRARLGSPGHYYLVDVGWLTGLVSLSEYPDHGR